MDVFIVIDIQQAYFKDRVQHNVDNALERINSVSNYFQRQQKPVFFIQHDGDGINTAAPHTDGWQLYTALQVADSDIVVRKILNDAFAYTTLHEQLKKCDASRLVISGWATDFCVDSTIRSAVNLGYDLVILSDCHMVTDRPSLSAQQVIDYHNWLWGNLIAPKSSITLSTAAEYLSLSAAKSL